MDWLNFHHLRYFWIVAKKGSLREAAEVLNVSQPSISAQISELETALGETLFARRGRGRVLTEVGQVVYGYAEEIFTLGQELMNAVRGRSGGRLLRLQIGIADSLPKNATNRILEPVFALPDDIHVVCKEGKLDDLLSQLVTHRLDAVLADEPATGTLNARTFNHRLGDSAVSICAAPELAKTLKRGFPKSLNGAPAFLPSSNTPIRRSLEKWFQSARIQPKVVAEFEDLALMKALAADGRGFIALPEVALTERRDRHVFVAVGRAGTCREEFFAITAERRITHPAIMAITNQAQRTLNE